MMKNRYYLIFLLTLLCFCHPASAQDDYVLSLDECKAIAMQNNNDIRNAGLDVTAANAQKKEVFMNYFPTVSGLGFAMHSLDYNIKLNVTDIFGKEDAGYNLQALWDEFYNEIGVSKTFNFLRFAQRYGLVLMQPVFAGGRIVNGNRYAALGIEAAGVKKELTERNVAEQVEKNYFAVSALNDKQKTLDALSILLDSLANVADIALSEGVILKADHMLLQTKKLELQNGQQKLRTGLKLMKMNLLNSMGMKYKVLEIDKYKFPEFQMISLPKPEEVYVDEEAVVSELEETRLLGLQVEAKKYEKKLTLGSTLPQLGLGFTYGYTRLSEFNNGRFNGSAFAVLQIPITDWAKNSYKMKRQQAEIEKAENDRDHLHEMLVLQQRKLYLELTSAWDALELAKSQKEYSDYLYQQAMLNHEAGYTTVTDLLQAYSNVASVSENYANAYSDYITALQVYTGRINN